jgi:Holliday junction resolvasome RuvABC endonuclease subunit
MNVLALDYAEQTGFAYQIGGKIFSGSVSFKQRKPKGEADRFLQFWRWLEEFENSELDFIVFEESAGRRTLNFVNSACGYRALVLLFCAAHQIGWQAVGPSQIKKATTGSGNADKQVMIAWAIAKGYNPADDNEADALAILHYALEKGGQA